MTPKYRVGIGYDCHRPEDGGPLRIGGCDVSFHRHLVGHSDADVLLHAITDAVLGGGSLGDIGEMFPNTDPANRGRDSADMLRAAYERVLKSGFEIVNLDCVVHAEQPKLVPYRTPIRRRVAQILGVTEEQIGVKAKTGEGLGSVGQGEMIAAQCVALLVTAAGGQPAE